MTKTDEGLEKRQVLCTTEASYWRKFSLLCRTSSPLDFKDHPWLRQTQACSLVGNSVTALLLDFMLPLLLGEKKKKYIPTSHPLLHRAFAVKYVAGCSFPLELEHSVNQDKEAQGQYARNDNGYSFHSAGCVVQFDDNVYIILRAVSVFVPVCWSITAHKILEDRSGISRFHPEHLIVEFPVFFAFVEICEACLETNIELFKRTDIWTSLSKGTY